jgi:hypothetical protein
MKTKVLISKMSRYLVLSKEFEQDVEDLFEDRAVDASSMTLTTSSGNLSYIGNTESNFQNVVIEAKTRAEVILEKAQSEANRSDRYDEYKKLQNIISKYCDGYFEFRTK